MAKYTCSAKESSEGKQWWLVDATDLVLGRMASKIAFYIRGKHSPMFTPNVDIGDFVIVINAEKVVLTGKKLNQKMYYRHSGYIGGLKSITAGDLIKKRPEDLVRFAVRGMLPKNRLGRKLIKKLKIYAGKEHPHGAQNPKVMDI